MDILICKSPSRPTDLSNGFVTRETTSHYDLLHAVPS
jgi:hypothetical protein